MQEKTRFLYDLTNKEDTGFVVASCVDNTTGVTVRTVLANSERSYPAAVAYMGAKFSRSRDGMDELLEEIEQAYKEGKLTPEKRLASIVNGLKHQSPAGMAHVVLAFENIPIETAAAVFRAGPALHDGQESSTRFIDFASGNDLVPLATLIPEGATIPESLFQEYSDLQKLSIGSYLSWYPRVYEAYAAHFKIDKANKTEESALSARSYDTVRGFLLSGLKTNMVWVANATSVQQLISKFGSGRVPGERHLSDTVLALLKPEMPVPGYYPEIKPLLNHTEPSFTTKEEQVELKRYLSQQNGFSALLSQRRSFGGIVDNQVDLLPEQTWSVDKIIAQQILTLYPSLKMKDILDFTKNLTDGQKSEVGRIIFLRRNRFSLPEITASAGPISLHMQIDLGIERDLGRHRAWERVSPLHETHVGLGEIDQTGFTQAAYLRQIPELVNVSWEMEQDMLKLYSKRREFLDKLSMQIGQEAADKVGVYLLPLAHQVDMVMHGDPRYLVHFQDTRIREGAHIDARLITASSNEQVARSNPFYSSLAYPTERVLVDDRHQFIDRS